MRTEMVCRYSNVILVCTDFFVKMTMWMNVSSHGMTG